MAKAARKAISKKTRFEVFKRDSFTCQYCGQSAPAVVLNVDHIAPVAKGGGNGILNLVTSCADCNGGKGARPLDDQSMLAKQRAQAVLLSERREQLEMMAQWRDSLQEIADIELAALVKAVEAVVRLELNGQDKNVLRKLLRKNGFTVAHESLQTCIDRYADWTDEGRATDVSLGLILRKVENVASYAKLPLDVQTAHYCRGILKNRLEFSPGSFYWNESMKILSRALECGFGQRELKELCKNVDDWDDFDAELCAFIGVTETRNGPPIPFDPNKVDAPVASRGIRGSRGLN